MTPITLTHILTVIVTLYTVESLSDDDIAKMLDERALREQFRDRREYPSNDDIDAFKERIDAIKRRNQDSNELFDTVESDDGAVDENAVSKRPFCNGFTGCGRIHQGKRSISSSPLLQRLRLSNSENMPESQVVSKRPFCNGFFGCGNPGKRIVFRNANFVRPISYNSAEFSALQKRFFCNLGVYGCVNQGKRSPYRSWIERMRTSGMAQLD